MSEEPLNPLENVLPDRWARHRFMALVTMTILIALFLVSVALALYASSGAAQLDLTRPDYTSVREQAGRSTTFDSFPANGPLNKETIDQFRKLYDQQAEKATNVDSFSGNAMNEQTLSIDAPVEAPVEN
jgi:hypothetical protein